MRELKALIDIDKEQWAGQMRDLLVEANGAVQGAIIEGAAALPTPVLRTLIKRYNAIVRRGLAFHRNQPPLARQIGARGRAPHRPGHNLLIRLHKFKRDVLQFLTDFAVPFTNNEAERDLRMMKVKMKISGGFRTMAGARTFARIRSVISTARKQGWNILQTLAANPAALIQSPRRLTDGLGVTPFLFLAPLPALKEATGPRRQLPVRANFQCRFLGLHFEFVKAFSSEVKGWRRF